MDQQAVASVSMVTCHLYSNLERLAVSIREMYPEAVKIENIIFYVLLLFFGKRI